MEEARQVSWLERFFWPLLVVVLAIIVVVFVLVLRWSNEGTQDLKSELNKRYVEKIDFMDNNRVNGTSQRVIVIDGDPRYDCKEKNARLTCSDDPQPTPRQ
ncbi:hypothetical protein GCM10011519_18360 [Marmoricola endophyticus]|uniref:Uncharacterized protein n=1 Tax=Marmoricola endophyticus TaxID=2040280 RepID=A0A917BHL1_9ACTN|nr:hypothetical protein GCM10011519_18360 [Marmoricola endophyticus]